MAKRTRSEPPQKQAIRDMMPVLLDWVLDEELNEALGCSKYDYWNKAPIISGMVILPKQCTQVMEIVDVAISRDRNGNYESQVIKKC